MLGPHFYIVDKNGHMKKKTRKISKREADAAQEIVDAYRKQCIKGIRSIGKYKHQWSLD
jgi:hypothetical protein